MKYPDDFINKIICADCIVAMKDIPNNLISTIICDPPYNLGFMGKTWDKTGIAFQKETWEECLRVAKPGATLLCFGGTRTYHRLVCAIEDAGWIIKDCIMWLYGSGFPKATDISKQLDKMAGKKGKVIGKEKIDKGIQKGSMHAGRKSEIVERDITEPSTPESKLWNGWKSHGLKPSYEPILIAMKPNEGSYAQNALKYGVAGLNIDGGRIPINKEKEIDNRVGTDRVRGDKKGLDSTSIFGQSKEGVQMYKDKGRFPSNIILNEEAAEILDEQSGESKSGKGSFKAKDYEEKETSTPFTRGNFQGKGDKGGASRFFKKIPYTYQDREYKVKGFVKNCKPQAPSNYNDGKNPSRFFYVAKASKNERNLGCEELEEKPAHNYGSIKKSEGRHGKNMPNANFHPTVKPLKLMEYLCLLTKTPTGGIVLDPFAGSGSTGMACQNTDRDFIGIEREPEYVAIARARLKHNIKQGRLTLS